VPGRARHRRSRPDGRARTGAGHARIRHGVLLATTIIENGIDIPACNTILINHAERFGLSRLHQLRGRVRAQSAGLLLPAGADDRILTSDARKLLAAIQGLDLGARLPHRGGDLSPRRGEHYSGRQRKQSDESRQSLPRCTRELEETIRELKGGGGGSRDVGEDLGVTTSHPHGYHRRKNVRIMF